MAKQVRRVWSLLTLADERQYGGNVGYDDTPASVYRYDSAVANSRQVTEGDIVVLRNAREIIGAAVA